MDCPSYFVFYTLNSWYDGIKTRKRRSSASTTDRGTTERTEGEEIAPTDDTVNNSDIIDTINALIDDTGDKHTARFAPLPEWGCIVLMS